MERMKRLKFLEIRDIATFIPAVAIDCTVRESTDDTYLLRRSGYGDIACVLLTRLDGGYAHYDPKSWGNQTWTTAHQFILDNWESIKDGDVIDVAFILGETAIKAESERTTHSELYGFGPPAT